MEDEQRRQGRADNPSDDNAGDSDDVMSMEELLEQMDAEEAAVREIKRGQVVDGTIVHVGADEVLVDVGLKAEGVIPGREVSDMEQEFGRPPHVGDQLLVYVMQTETPEGHPLLSFRRASTERFWRRAQDQVQTGEVVEARVVDVNRGGVVVDFGTRAFVPISQLVTVQRNEGDDEDQVLEQLRGLVGKRLKLKVIEADRRRNRLILSERQANRELRSQRRDALMDELEPGQVRTGRISNIASFGAFVDLGGADGLVHISELSWSRVKHPSEIVKPGQEVQVYVISVDRDAKKIALSIRQAQEDPWYTIEDRHPLGSIVTGEITKQAQFGVFVKVEDGVEGLVHNSEIAPSDRRLLQEGNTLPFRVISVDYDRRRLRLSPAPDAMVEELQSEEPQSEEPQSEEPQSEESPSDEPRSEGEAPDLNAGEAGQGENGGETSEPVGATSG